MRLQDKTAVVTGASRGIGEGVARALHAQGARVFLLARSEESLRALAGELEAGWAVCDVSREDSVREAMEAARQHLGRVDILVNNAGVASSAPVHRLTLAEWERLQGINATGTFLCTREVIEEMAERGWGRIINVASVAALGGGRYIAGYCASKHAVLGFTRAAALDVASRGVTVNCVCPGYVDTPMSDATIANVVKVTKRAPEEARKVLEKTNPQGRLFEVEEVAHAVLFLCDPLSRGINGQALTIDGGGSLA